MKRLSILTVALLLTIMSLTTLANACGSVVKHVAADGTALYTINMPTDISYATESVKYDSWECDDGQMVGYSTKIFYYQLDVLELTKYNRNTLNLSGQGWLDFGASDFDSDVSADADKKRVSIAFAFQDCRQMVVQTYNSETQKYECTVDTEYTCYEPDYYIKGEVLLSIKPVGKVRPVKTLVTKK